MKVILQIFGALVLAVISILGLAFVAVKSGLHPAVLAVVSGIAVVAFKLKGSAKKKLRKRRGGSLALTDSEKEMGHKIGFGEDTLSTIKSIAGVPLEQFRVRKQLARNVAHAGVEFSSSQDDPRELVHKLRARLAKQGYTVAVCEYGTKISPSRVCVVKCADKYEILRLLGVDGINEGIGTDDLIAKLQEWEKRSPFDLYGADLNTVEIEFDRVPDDVNAFAKEVCRFCPASESADDVLNQLKSRRLYLWWD